MKHTFLLFLSLISLTGCVLSSTPPPPIATAISPTDTPTPTVTPLPNTIPLTDIFDANQRLERSVNLADALEATGNGWVGHELESFYFDLIVQAGFTAIRLPVNFCGHADQNPPYEIDASFFNRVDLAVEKATSRGLVVILDLHNCQKIFDNPTGNTPFFLAIWKQIAEHYQDYLDSQIYFDLCNEPTDTIYAGEWNNLVAQVISAIRQSNPTRPIVVGSINWNGYNTVEYLQLPDDQNIIVTFHYYLPLEFTNQGADWWGTPNAWVGTKWEGTPDETATINQHFDVVANWAASHNRPVFLGEFGSFDAADMESREHWTTAVRQAAEEHGFSWAYWDFFGDSTGLYELAYSGHFWHKWLLKALIPNSPILSLP